MAATPVMTPPSAILACLVLSRYPSDCAEHEVPMPQFQPTVFPDIRLPLSGNVDQTINPWTWFFRGITQFGLININLGQSSDPDLEQSVLNEVGSYGRQIGQISDALDVLLRHVPLENLNKHDRDALTDFRLQLEQVNRLKEKRGRKRLPQAA
jgi:hypothetical protein